MIKLIKLPPRTKLYGYDYSKNVQLRMTGKEWHAYARRETAKGELDGDDAVGGLSGIDLDGTFVKG